jgi:hypothetical protein
MIAAISGMKEETEEAPGRGMACVATAKPSNMAAVVRIILMFVKI